MEQSLQPAAAGSISALVLDFLLKKLARQLDFTAFYSSVASTPAVSSWPVSPLLPTLCPPLPSVAAAILLEGVLHPLEVDVEVGMVIVVAVVHAGSHVTTSIARRTIVPWKSVGIY